ncbi:MAG: L,D-transpeptidase [Xanthobacteraceae bacterium]|nr:L,D-transpeptidase [Xanthobacteraceae bacterium]
MLTAAIGCAATAQAAVVVHIQLSRQVMTVEVDGQTMGNWPVSTARPGYRTPEGTFRPYRLEVMHRSSLYEWTPMPYSIFFDGNYAIHGTGAVGQLGRPVSHGCVRLSPANARALFSWVQAHGAGGTVIEITD